MLRAARMFKQELKNKRTGKWTDSLERDCDSTRDSIARV